MNIKWEEGAHSPVHRRDHTAVWLNGIVYVGGGGWDDINCYDPGKNSWTSPINTPYSLFTMTAINNNLVTGGGQDRSNNVTNQVLIMDADQLKNYTKMITARSLATAAGHQGMLVITGGKDSKGKTISSTELFDSSNDQWYTCSDLPQPHSELKSVIVDNTLYLLGGLNKACIGSSAVFTAPLDTLSAHQLKWNTHQDTPWCNSAPISVNGTHLLIVGGSKGLSYTSDIHKLNKVSHRWEAIGHIPSARSRPGAVSTADNGVIVIGGENDWYEATITVWIGSCEPQ